jgi:polysaccharide export outer membrane protein
MRYLIIIYLFVAVAFTSCSYKQDQILLQQKNNILDTSSTRPYANISNYRIKPQDILQINNVQASKSLVDVTAGVINNGSPGLTPLAQADTYTVEEDGTVALTGLGRVKVAGLTRIEARNYIESLYKKTILKEPLFDLKIINLKVTLFGEVKAPGQITLLHDNTTLIEVLAQVGGLTDKADNRTVKIVRGGPGTPKTDVIDLSDAKILTDPKIFVQNNDIVVVAQNKRALRSEKLQDFSTTVSPFLLVFNTALIIISLIRR